MSHTSAFHMTANQLHKRILRELVNKPIDFTFDFKSSLSDFGVYADILMEAFEYLERQGILNIVWNNDKTASIHLNHRFFVATEKLVFKR